MKLFVDFDTYILPESCFSDAHVDPYMSITRMDLERIMKHDCRDITHDSLKYYIKLINSQSYSCFLSFLKSSCKRHIEYSVYDPDNDNYKVKLFIISACSFLSENSISGIFFSNIPHEPFELILAFSAHLLNIRTISSYQVGGYIAGASILYANVPFFKSAPIPNKQKHQVYEFKCIIDQLINVKITSLPPPFYVPKKVINLISISEIYFYLSYVLRDFYKFLIPSTSQKMRIAIVENHSMQIKSFLSWFNLRSSFDEAKIIESKRYIYVPLQYEPELSSMIEHNGITLDSEDLICISRARFSSSIPLIIRENPAMKPYKRKPSFYKIIKSLPNVYFSKYATHQQLLDNCLAVAVGRSTPGFEGLTLFKPVFLLDNFWYYSCLTYDLFGSVLDNDDLISLGIPSAFTISTKISQVLHKFMCDPVYAYESKSYCPYMNGASILHAAQKHLNN